MSSPNDKDCFCGHASRGYRVENRVLSKLVERSVHLYKHHRPSWEIDAGTLDYHVIVGDVSYIELINIEPPYESYIISLADAQAHCIPVERASGDDTYMINLNYWKVVEGNHPEIRQPKLL